MNRTYAVCLVGIAASAAALGLFACSSSSTTPTKGVTPDSGTDTNVADTYVAPTGDAGADTYVAPTGDAATDGACAKPPVLHVPSADGGIYCPYSFNDATDAGTQYCANGTEQCCLSSSSDAGPSTCESFTGADGGYNSACPAAGATVWQCASPSDCTTAAGPTIAGAPAGAAGDPIVCCLIGGSLTADTACTGFEKTHFGGTTCQPKSACVGSVSVPAADGGTGFTDPLYVVCEQDSDCAAGTKCQAIFTTGTAIGICQ